MIPAFRESIQSAGHLDGRFAEGQPGDAVSAEGDLTMKFRFDPDLEFQNQAIPDFEILR